MTQDKTTLSKIRWRCHRGMLELDIMLLNYFEKAFIESSEAQQQDFVELLTQADPVLFAWLMGHEQVSDTRLEDIVARIRNIPITDNSTTV